MKIKLPQQFDHDRILRLLNDLGERIRCAVRREIELTPQDEIRIVEEASKIAEAALKRLAHAKKEL